MVDGARVTKVQVGKRILQPANCNRMTSKESARWNLKASDKLVKTAA